MNNCYIRGRSVAEPNPTSLISIGVQAGVENERQRRDLKG